MMLKMSSSTQTDTWLVRIESENTSELCLTARPAVGDLVLTPGLRENRSLQECV
jgi:hypothetical protein